MTALRHGAASHTGRVRSVNQDASLVAEPLFAVADGMGGAAAGEVASQIAVEALRVNIEPSTQGLVHAVRVANRAVWDQAAADPSMRGMGTTVCAIVVVPADRDDGAANGADTIAVANVGDSRIYLLRDGELDQITEDHSLVEDLVRQGRITAEEARTHPQRNIVTRVLGSEDDVEVDTWQIDPFTGDRFLLCSDGLFNEVEDDRIAGVLRRLADPADAAAELVRLANEAGGRDNITVVVVDVVDDDDRALAASAAIATQATPATSTGGPPGGSGRSEPSEAGEGARAAGSAPTGSAPTAVAPTGGSAVGAAAGAAGALPAPAETTPEVETRQERRARRKAGPRPRRFTWRVAVFLLAVVLVLGAAGGGIAWFARNTYYVGLDGEDVVIYQGRPGGVLWLQPTLAERTGLTFDEVPQARRPDVEAGKQAADLEGARLYVERLEDQARRLPGSTTTTTATTAPGATPTTAPGATTTTAG